MVPKPTNKKEKPQMRKRERKCLKDGARVCRLGSPRCPAENTPLAFTVDARVPDEVGSIRREGSSWSEAASHLAAQPGFESRSERALSPRPDSLT